MYRTKAAAEETETVGMCKYLALEWKNSGFLILIQLPLRRKKLQPEQGMCGSCGSAIKAGDGFSDYRVTLVLWSNDGDSATSVTCFRYAVKYLLIKSKCKICEMKMSP